MNFNIIPKSKFGTCTICGTPDTECVKLQKSLVCLLCRRDKKNKVQITKANERNKVRSLGNKQVQSGNYEDASKAALMADCDYVFSRIVRLRAADEYGNCECYTCGNKKHWSLQQCGHFVKRGNKALRFDFRNSRVQDKHCNEHLDGNIDVYRQKLNEEEPGLAEQLEMEGREVFKYSIEELKGLLIDLRAKLKPLELKFNQIKNIQ